MRCSSVDQRTGLGSRWACFIRFGDCLPHKVVTEESGWLLLAAKSRARMARPSGHEDRLLKAGPIGHNANHVAAPMPGSISSIAVKPGQDVKIGDILLSIEAMKMETTISAPRDGTVRELLIGPGQPVDAKDLLAVIG